MQEETKIRVVVKEPGKMPEVRMVEPTLEAWQELVGGDIELAFVGAGREPNITMYIHGEGKFEGLLPNVGYGARDYIAGTLVVVEGDDEGASRALTDEEVRLSVEWLTKFHITHHPDGSFTRSA